jgi:hypothetical protein
MSLNIDPMVARWFARIPRVYKIGAGVFTAIGVCWGGYNSIKQELAPPTIHPLAGKVESPFEATFTVLNPHHFLAVKEVKFMCLLDNATYPNNGYIDHDAFEFNAPPIILLPNKSKQYLCPINRLINVGVPLSASIRISIVYRELGGTENFTSEIFNWNVSTKEWSEGQIVS